jgi:hypothetical protein
LNAVWKQLILSTKTGKKYTVISDFDPSDKRLSAGEMLMQVCLGRAMWHCRGVVAVAVEQQQASL